jgi:hypothetical protein
MELLGDLFLQMLKYRLPDVLDVCVVAAPRIDAQAFLLVQERLQQSHVRRIWICVHHALEANIFVQPNAPVDLVFLVDRKLLAEQIITLFVDPLVAFFIGTRIHRTEFAVPDLPCISVDFWAFAIGTILTGTFLSRMKATLRSYWRLSVSICSSVPSYGCPAGNPMLE